MNRQETNRRAWLLEVRDVGVIVVNLEARPVRFTAADAAWVWFASIETARARLVGLLHAGFIKIVTKGHGIRPRSRQYVITEKGLAIE